MIFNRLRQEFGPRRSSSHKQTSRRSKKGAHSIAAPVDTIDARDILETYVELRLAEFLRDFSLSSLPEAVHKLTGAGYTTSESLRALDPPQCSALGFRDDDAERLLLASWLDGYGLHQYGRGLIAAGCDSPLHLVGMNDADLKSAGMQSIGHRRQIQRYLRTDEPLQGRLAALRAEAEAQEAQARAQMQRASGGALSSSPGKRSGAHVRQKEPDRGPLFGIDAEALEASLEVGASRSTGASDARAWDESWNVPWRTTGNAALFGAAPGLLAEAHGEAQTPRDGIILMHNDGSSMKVW